MPELILDGQGMAIIRASGQPIHSPLPEFAEMGEALVNDTQAVAALAQWPSDLYLQASDAVTSLAELSKRFKPLERIAGMLAATLENWQPPKLVMVGAENTRKSTLLNRLALVPVFPIDDQVCTRTMIELKLQHADQSSVPDLIMRSFNTGEQIGETQLVPLVNGLVDVRDAMRELLLQVSHRGRSPSPPLSLSTSPPEPSVKRLLFSPTLPDTRQRVRLGHRRTRASRQSHSRTTSRSASRGPTCPTSTSSTCLASRTHQGAPCHALRLASCKAAWPHSTSM